MWLLAESRQVKKGKGVASLDAVQEMATAIREEIEKQTASGSSRLVSDIVEYWFSFSSARIAKLISKTASLAGSGEDGGGWNPKWEKEWETIGAEVGHQTVENAGGDEPWWDRMGAEKYKKTIDPQERFRKKFVKDLNQQFRWR